MGMAGLGGAGKARRVGGAGRSGGVLCELIVGKEDCCGFFGNG